MSERKKRRFSIITMPKEYDGWIHLSIIVLAIFGTLMVGSASMGLAVGDTQYLLFTIIKQIVFVILGYFVMVFLANSFSLNILRKQSFVIIIILTYAALLVCLLFPGTNATYAWISITIGGNEVSIQPSEFAKITGYLTIATTIYYNSYLV